MIEDVVAALSQLRCPFTPLECSLHIAVADCLKNSGIPFKHEAVLYNHCRIDFLAGNIGIEIKKGKPNAIMLKKQLEKYAVSDKINAIILITPALPHLPESINGKEIRVLSLNRLWGLSIP